MELEKLPTDIATNIFARLPYDSVIQCKCVSKSWFNLLHLFIHSTDLYFAKLHQYHHHLKSSSSLPPDSVLLLLDQSSAVDDTEQQLQLHYAEYDEEDQEGGGGGRGFNCRVIKKLNCPLEMNSKFWAMATSSNGLICSVYQTVKLCIYNPFLGEYVTLPNKQQFNYYSAAAAFGFGYIPSTDEYKVVRIVYPPGGGDVGNVEVYTLGKSTDHWRSKGNIKCRLQCDSPGVLVNGSIHWLTEKKKNKKKKKKMKQNILAFDLLEEEFHEKPLPRGLHTNTDFKIKELEGCLCGIDYRDKTRKFSMWRMEDYYMKNNKKEEEEEDYWKKIFWIIWEGPEGYEHCFFWKKVDQALLWTNSSVVSTEIDDSVGPKLNEEDLSSARLFHGILHIKNFVSLTALGEYNTKTIKDDGKRKRDNDKDEMNKKRKTKKLMKILFGKKQ